ncbi:hypothetical protein [Bradyrhizobium ganzhouense]|uniref:hypothetical protein n=1 Tax=Bradyrhizobium ganzhouense TaxID=1179767 RepID=UPI003CED6536
MNDFAQGAVPACRRSRFISIEPIKRCEGSPRGFRHAFFWLGGQRQSGHDFVGQIRHFAAGD